MFAALIQVRSQMGPGSTYHFMKICYDLEFYLFQGQNMNPLPGSAPRGRGPPVKRHQNIHVNMEQERESVSPTK